MTSIMEDPVRNPGTLVKNFASSLISDPDPGALKGIGVIDALTTNGKWQFTVNGTTWFNVGQSPNRLLCFCGPMM